MTIVTFDPAQIASTDIALSNGNLTALELAAHAFQYQTASATLALAAAKVYFEIYWNTWTTPAAATQIGLAAYNPGGTAYQSQALGNFTGTAAWRCDPPSNTFWYVNNSGFNSIPTWSQGNTCQVAIDGSAQLFWGQVSGTSGWNAGAGNPALGTGGYSFSVLGTGVLYPTVQFDNTIFYEATANFGGSTFAYAVPAGFAGIGTGAGSLMPRACLRILNDGKRFVREWIKEKERTIYLPPKPRLILPWP